MYCSRLDHFVRFNSNGTIGKCGHMVGAPGFDSWESMQQSAWLSNTRASMNMGIWPDECRRCRDTEQDVGHSIRLSSNDRDLELRKVRSDYIILGGVLDNICNSACQTCHAGLSTKIGSLSGSDYKQINNESLFVKVPMDRVLEIDINGGEPTASPAYQKLLQDLPAQIKILRINTNGSRVLPNFQDLLDRGIKIIITLSLDGTGRVHDYVRWPIKWGNYQDNVETYVRYRDGHDNLELQAWTVVSALNLQDWPNIVRFAQEMRLNHSWAFLDYPIALDPRFNNRFTRDAKSKLSHMPEFKSVARGINNQIEIDRFLEQQDQLRNINFRDYL